jgi:hypothetical protein
LDGLWSYLTPDLKKNTFHIALLSIVFALVLVEDIYLGERNIFRLKKCLPKLAKSIA